MSREWKESILKKRICKATNNSKIKRADFKYQLLFNELDGNISAYQYYKRKPLPSGSGWIFYWFKYYSMI